jgi:hypothetical protein
MSWHAIGKKVTVPALLAVSPLGLGCGTGDDATDDTAADTTAATSSPTSSADDAPPADTSDGTGGTSTSTATATSGTTGNTSTGDDGAGTDTGGTLGCDAILEEAECGDAMYCVWFEPGYCAVQCSDIPDEATCVAQQVECFWDGKSCMFGGI